jgi:hypothetical protein
MKSRFLTLFCLALALAALACSRSDFSRLPIIGSSSEPTPTAVAAVGDATPTLAATASPNAEATAQAEAEGEDGTPTASAGDDNGTPGAVGDEASGSGPSDEATPGSGESGENGESNDGQGSNGEAAAEGQNDPPAAGCPASGQNLLLNPSFEGPYEPYASIGELNRAAEWVPFWFDGDNNQRPEFKPATLAVDPRRVHSGEMAQQYFKSHGQFKAGIYQVVFDVPLNANLQFSIFGQGWSCDDTANCPGGVSGNPANMLMRVGIDPQGGSNAFSSDVIWSPYFNPIDRWQVACVTAVSRRDIVTVFAWASPDQPRQNQDIYWDDAALVVVP